MDTVQLVLNTKALEKQIKLFDARLEVLKAEVAELERKKAACELLLGTSAEPVKTEEKKRKPKAMTVARIVEVLEKRADGLALPDLALEVGEGVESDTLQELLGQHPELFSVDAEAKWTTVAKAEGTLQ